jgi:hypothetical protein
MFDVAVDTDVVGRQPSLSAPTDAVATDSHSPNVPNFTDHR